MSSDMLDQLRQDALEAIRAALAVRTDTPAGGLGDEGTLFVPLSRMLLPENLWR